MLSKLAESNRGEKNKNRAEPKWWAENSGNRLTLALKVRPCAEPSFSQPPGSNLPKSCQSWIELPANTSFSFSFGSRIRIGVCVRVRIFTRGLGSVWGSNSSLGPSLSLDPSFSMTDEENELLLRLVLGEKLSMTVDNNK